jgi:hypothetical protein
MPIIGYYHICAINNYHSIIRDQISDIKRSGLYAATDHINVSIVSPHKPFIPELKDPKFRIRYSSQQLHLFERPILNIMREDCLKHKANLQPMYVWYIHTKGVSGKNQNPKRQAYIQQWRKVMQSIVVWNWEACLNKISKANYDTCGMNYTNWVTNMYHYAGNFWWARASYIIKLPQLALIKFTNKHQYLEPEMWIGLKNPRAFNFFTLAGKDGVFNLQSIPDLTKLRLKVAQVS